MTWLVEQGIGEERAIRFDGSRIIAARLHWPGSLVPGQIEDAKLAVRRAGTARGAVIFGNGQRAHVDGLPRSASEGATIRVEVTRARTWESGRTKIAQCRPSEKPLRPALGLAEQLVAEGESVEVVHRFPTDADWTELWVEIDSQTVEFAQGWLRFYPTPAMLLIDIDGEDDPVSLSTAAAEPLARAILRWDLGGNIGVDFPTIAARDARKRVDAALDEVLRGWLHERTAMNGFGFVQLVARLKRPSLLNLISHNRAGAKARALLREAEGLSGAGDVSLVCVDWVAKAMKEEWLAELARRTGRGVHVRVDPDRLDIESCFAQIVPR